jgi:hypothetical protein
MKANGLNPDSSGSRHRLVTSKKKVSRGIINKWQMKFRFGFVFGALAPMTYEAKYQKGKRQTIVERFDSKTLEEQDGSTS